VRPVSLSRLIAAALVIGTTPLRRGGAEWKQD